MRVQSLMQSAECIKLTEATLRKAANQPDDTLLATLAANVATTQLAVQNLEDARTRVHQAGGA
jgi:hypothetical protein